MSMNISRRSFMKGAAAASLAVAASTMLTGCDMPKWDDMFGGIFGNRSKTININKSESINIALTDYRVDSVCVEYLPEFKVVNNAGSPVKVADTVPSAGSNNAYYTLVPTFEYIGTSGNGHYINTSKSTLLNKEIAKGENATGVLCLNMSKISSYTGIELTLTAYDGNGNKVGEPAVFPFEK